MIVRVGAWGALLRLVVGSLALGMMRSGRKGGAVARSPDYALPRRLPAQARPSTPPRLHPPALSVAKYYAAVYQCRGVSPARGWVCNEIETSRLSQRETRSRVFTNS